MKLFKSFFVATGLVLCALTSFTHALAEEAPDALVKRISTEVLETARRDHAIQRGDRMRVVDLVEARILPHIDLERTTALATGRFWREATAEQRRKLVDEFRKLLIYTYSGALSQVKDEIIEFRPLRAAPDDTEVEVRGRVLRPRRGDPVQFSYRLVKTPDGWKIYDVNVLDVWLIETYKGNFAAEIERGGIEGLIRALSDRNRKLAAGPAKAP